MHLATCTPGERQDQPRKAVGLVEATTAQVEVPIFKIGEALLDPIAEIAGLPAVGAKRRVAGLLVSGDQPWVALASLMAERQVDGAVLFAFG